MTKSAGPFVRKRSHFTNYLRFAAAAAVLVVLIVSVLIVRTDTEASSQEVSRRTLGPAAAGQPTPETPGAYIPPQTPATRIKIGVGEKMDLQVATGVDSFVVVSPEIAFVGTRDRYTLSISAAKVGETILIITYGRRRMTYVVEIVGRQAGIARRSNLRDQTDARLQSTTSGSMTTLYSQGFGGGGSVLRQSLDYRKEISAERTLRVSGDMVKPFGRRNAGLAFAHLPDFAVNRLTIGVDTPTRTIEILDSQIRISPLSLNNYTVRGFHLSSNAESDPKRILPKNGIEVFAGLARPAFGFFNSDGGKVAGVLVPVVSREKFQARAGVIAISADRRNRLGRGGVIIQADATYSPVRQVLANVEMAYANGKPSWRGRLDLTFVKYGGSAEITRFDRSSPFNSIGAQPGGRRSEALSFYWRPITRVATGIGYNRTAVSRLTNSHFADFDRSLFFANASFGVAKGSRINLRYTDQNIETAFPGSPSRFKIETRTLMIGSSNRISKNWSNTIEGRINFNREANAGAGLETGFGLNEQLRYTRRDSSVTGFVRYNHKTPSLTSLIVRNPALLPPDLQAAFALDPAEFLRAYRDRLAYLLDGIELPQTRSFDAGARFQKIISRYTVGGEIRYNAGEIYAVNQKNIYASASVGVRLDRANSIEINAWRSMGGRSQGGVTFSYTHQFGSAVDSFQFSNLLGFNRSKVRGRVFYDLNGNGLSEAGEPGVAGMKVEVDGKRSVLTDKDGRYEMTASEGRHNIVLVSADLGIRLLASTSTDQTINLGGGKKPDVNFGVRDSGSISGRIFNDVNTSPADEVQNGPGLGGIRVTLRPSGTGSGSFALEQITAANGTYEFTNLRPGQYLVEIDPSSLPANFRVPGITGSSINVTSLHASNYDVPISAERAIAGVIYIDKDGDGTYKQGTDQTVSGASVLVNGRSAVSGIDGGYIVRGLPDGMVTLSSRSSTGVEGMSVVIELGIEPSTSRSINLRVLE